MCVVWWCRVELGLYLHVVAFRVILHEFWAYFLDVTRKPPKLAPSLPHPLPNLSLSFSLFVCVFGPILGPSTATLTCRKEGRVLTPPPPHFFPSSLFLFSPLLPLTLAAATIIVPHPVLPSPSPLHLLFPYPSSYAPLFPVSFHFQHDSLCWHIELPI